jgi:hypothetical protein
MARKLPRLTVSDNRRFIVTEQGDPFFWLGDTAWELFHRLNREDARYYFSNRQANRFNVIQAVALAEVDGLNEPDVYGERPLIQNDPARPNEAYFNRVDEYIQMAEERDLYIGLLPTWGDKVTHMWGAGPVVFTPENAYQYGLILGRRFRDQQNIIWVLGGDRPPVQEEHDYRPIWREMSRGIREGVGATLLMTYHPMGGRSTSAWLHEEPWLDMNMMQSGHGGGHDVPVWEMVQRDYQLQPVKPTLDGEPNYEDHPVNPWPKWDPATGYYRDHDVRKQAYRSVFAGACGVTYGHHSVWQMYDQGREPINHPDRTWREALDRPAAAQVQYLRALMESRPYLSRIPDQSLLSDPGEKGTHIRATRDENGDYAFVYLPEPNEVTVRLNMFKGGQVQAQWYDPRSGNWTTIGLFAESSETTFTPPAEGPDWVLVLDAVDP